MDDGSGPCGHKSVGFESPLRHDDILYTRNLLLDNGLRVFYYKNSMDIMGTIFKKNSFLKNILLVLLNSGMRRGELIDLEWSDIDFERRVIKIKLKEFWTPKNLISREIPMNDVVYEVLHKQKEIGNRDRWVFTYENGKQLDQHIREP